MLRVWVDNLPVGVLDRSGSRGSTFVYDVKTDDRHAVSLTMPKRTESWNTPFGLAPIFDMNLPEGALRDRLRRRFAKATGTFDDFDLLSIVGRSQIGRIRCSGLDETLDEDVPFQSIDEILRARRDGGLFDYLLETFAVHSGLAGVQPKIMIRGVEDNDTNRHSQSVRGATHIVKLWDPNEYPELAANEFFCLTAARKLGFTVPDFSLSEDGSALVVERFDLSDGIYQGFEDFCVLNGLTSDRKYSGGYENRLFRRIRDFVSPENRQAALETAFRLFVLNCTIRNGDAHLKNFGLIYRDTQSPVNFAPIYDLITTRAYLDEDLMALSLDGTTRWPDRRKITRLGQTRADLRPQKISEIIEETADVLSGLSQQVTEYFSASRHRRVGEGMLAHWQEGILSLNPDRTLIQLSSIASQKRQ